MSSNDRMSLFVGDITTLKVDVIVNAANTTLLGGGGVDGAIHRAAGAELLRECQLLGGCRTGDAKLTKGYKLQARWVVHAVGPVWSGGERGETDLLRSCYRKSLEFALSCQATSVAFPAISTGAYRFPREEATRIALNETASFLDTNDLPQKVIFACFDKEMAELYERILAEMHS